MKEEIMDIKQNNCDAIYQNLCHIAKAVERHL